MILFATLPTNDYFIFKALYLIAGVCNIPAGNA